jgi:uncharacterized protein (DUF2336 family)
MTASTPLFAKLATLDSQKSSDDRREIMREVTAVLDMHSHSTLAELKGVDEMLASVASQFSSQVRREFARLVATGISGFECFTEKLALDEVDVSSQILRHSRIISKHVLLKVIKEKTDDHRMHITGRGDLCEDLSDALVQHGGDEVVVALLKNETAQIAVNTYDTVAKRAETSTVLQSPLVRRKGVPLDVLQELYLQVEGELRQEIVAKFGAVAPEELERAFARSRDRVSRTYRAMPDDFAAASQRIDDLQKRVALTPPALVTLLREGPQSRTAFKLGLARLTDVEFDIVDRAVEARDLDTIALLCRGTSLERALFVAFAIALSPDAAMQNAEEFARMYESVPVQAAQRALRFWKVRQAA